MFYLSPLAPNDPRHGTRNGYMNLRCRCTACKAAHVVYQRKERALRKSRIQPDDPRHGTYGFYANHSCRCDRCKSANAAVSRIRNTKRKENA